MSDAAQLTAPAPDDTLAARQEADKAPEVTSTQPAPQPVPTPNKVGAVVQLAPAPGNRSRADRKAAQRARAAAYRERKAAQRAEQDQAHAAEQAAEQVTAAKRAAETEAMRVAAEKVTREALADKESMVCDAIAGTTEAVADTVHLIFLDKKDPRFGNERSKSLGELWAPILAPYINERTAKALVILMGVGGTASGIYSWAHEIQQVRADRGGQ